MAKKILINNSGETLQILRREVEDQSQYEIPHYFWDELSDNSDIADKIISGDLIVNNGDETLTAEVGLAHIQNGVLKVSRSMNIIAGLGENCPELIQLNSASVGFEVEINDKGYVKARADNIIGDSVGLTFYFCSSNTESKKYISFKAHILTTNGSADKYLDQKDQEFSFGPVELETDPYKIFKYTVQLPATLFQNAEHFIFIGLERVENSTSYETPISNPIIVQIDQTYWKKVI